jgi:hypothetical protein
MSMSPWLQFSMFPCLHFHVSMSPCPCFHVPEFRKRKMEVRKRQLSFNFCKWKMKTAYPIRVLQTEMENGRLFFLVGKRLTVINDCCFSKHAHLWLAGYHLQKFKISASLICEKNSSSRLADSKLAHYQKQISEFKISTCSKVPLLPSF